MASTSPVQPTDTSESGERRRDRGRLAEAGIVPALVLIAIGAIFLLQNFGQLPGWGNWWALFILIPAAGAAGTAWTLYRRADNHLTPPARRAALSAATFTFVAAMFLFNLNWGLLWPVFLIFFGLEALASRTA